jgi:hypothetical protein
VGVTWDVGCDEDEEEDDDDDDAVVGAFSSCRRCTAAARTSLNSAATQAQQFRSQTMQDLGVQTRPPPDRRT